MRKAEATCSAPYDRVSSKNGSNRDTYFILFYLLKKEKLAFKRVPYLRIIQVFLLYQYFQA